MYRACSVAMYPLVLLLVLKNECFCGKCWVDFVLTYLVFQVEHSIPAHTNGLESMDARGEYIATCGYGTRQGQVMAELYVKVGCSCTLGRPSFFAQRPALLS